MFDISREQNNGLEKIKLTNQSTGESVSIIPAFGANVNELILKKDNLNYSVLDGNHLYTEFHGNNIFRGAKLAPCFLLNSVLFV